MSYMLRKIIAIVLCFLLAITILPVKGSKKNSDFLNNGWLEVREGVKILYLNGSNYEMGFQHGFLLKEEVKQNIRAFLNYAQNYSNVSFDYLLDIWSVMKNYIPQEYIDELQGIAHGAQIPF